MEVSSYISKLDKPGNGGMWIEDKHRSQLLLKQE